MGIYTSYLAKECLICCRQCGGPGLVEPRDTGVCLSGISIIARIVGFCSALESFSWISPKDLRTHCRYNEETVSEKIEQTLTLEYPPDKDGNHSALGDSTDRTDEIVKSFYGSAG